MAKFVHFNIEGAEMDLPTHYDERSKMDIEQYPDLIENPVYTPKGERVMLTIEDACKYSEPAEGEPRCIDCGSCRYYRQTKGTLLGVCGNTKMRSGVKTQETEPGVKEE